jgi:hypothetical protein
MASPIIPQASNRQSSVQSVGQFQASIYNPIFAIGGGALTIPIRGIKLDSTFVTSSQMLDTSKRIPLIDGSTAALINAVTAGVLTFRCVRVGQTLNSGDLPTIAQFLQKAGDTQGSQIQVSYSFATGGGVGTTETWTFNLCTLVHVPPLNLAGNDIAEYEVAFSYDDYSRAP